MIILTLNAGSSSLKFNVINMETESSMADGIAERIGLKDGFIRWTIQGEKGRLESDMKDHREALGHILEKLNTFAADVHGYLLSGARIARPAPAAPAAAPVKK